MIFAFFPNPIMVFTAEVLHGSTGGVIRPALAAVGLGLVGHGALSGRLGRNHRYDAFGNALTAALAGLLAHFTVKQTTFLVAAALCVPAGYALTRIRGAEIDYARARSARDREKPRHAAPLRQLLQNCPLLVFVGTLVIFQLANASIMPLASERLGQQHQHESELVTAALVVVPQVIIGLIAAGVARRAEDWGRKPLLLIGYAVLPVRAALFALAPGPWYLVGVQTLGGLTAAVIGIMTPLVIADVTRGMGRYNLAQGAAGTATGLGASVSTTASGYVAQLFGYTIGFFGLATVALIGLGCLYWFLPETRPRRLAKVNNVTPSRARHRGVGAPSPAPPAVLPSDRR